MEDNTFDVHFENASVLESSTSLNNSVSIDNTTTLNFTSTLTKPTDFIEFSFYVVNDGSVDAIISSITTSLTEEQEEYIDYNYKYDIDDSEVKVNDFLYRGQARKIVAHFEYNYDVDDFYTETTLSTTITIKYSLPEKITTTVWNYEYAGRSQVFIVPKTGTYKIELWGAQSGGSHEDSIRGGFGSYTSGNIKLNKNEVLYIYIGQVGYTAKKMIVIQIILLIVP